MIVKYLGDKAAVLKIPQGVRGLKGDNGAGMGYGTKALMDAAVGTYADGNTVLVTNDPLPANNGTWRKTGGVFVQESFSRVANLETNVGIVGNKLPEDLNSLLYSWTGSVLASGAISSLTTRVFPGTFKGWASAMIYSGQAFDAVQVYIQVAAGGPDYVTLTLRNTDLSIAYASSTHFIRSSGWRTFTFPKRIDSTVITAGVFYICIDASAAASLAILPGIITKNSSCADYTVYPEKYIQAGTTSFINISSGAGLGAWSLPAVFLNILSNALQMSEVAARTTGLAPNALAGGNLASSGAGLTLYNTAPDNAPIIALVQTDLNALGCTYAFDLTVGNGYRGNFIQVATDSYNLGDWVSFSMYVYSSDPTYFGDEFDFYLKTTGDSTTQLMQAITFNQISTNVRQYYGSFQITGPGPYTRGLLGMKAATTRTATIKFTGLALAWSPVKIQVMPSRWDLTGLALQNIRASIAANTAKLSTLQTTIFDPSATGASVATVAGAIADINIIGFNPAKFYSLAKIARNYTGSWWVQLYQADDINGTNFVLVAQYATATSPENGKWQAIALSTVANSVTGSVYIKWENLPAAANLTGMFANSYKLGALAFQPDLGNSAIAVLANSNTAAIAAMTTNIAKLKAALSDDFHSTVNIRLIGDSITWGYTATGSAVDTPRTHSLTDPRNNFTCNCWANLLRNYLGAKYAGGTVQTAAPGAGYFTKTCRISFSDPGFTKKDDSGNLMVKGMGSNAVFFLQDFMDISYHSGYHEGVEFDFYGSSITLHYWQNTGYGTVECFVDGVSVGTANANGSSNYDAQATFNFTLGQHHIRIQNNNATSGGFRATGLTWAKTVLVANDGLIGTASNEWIPGSANLTGSIQTSDEFVLVNIGTNDRGTAVVPYSEQKLFNNLTAIVVQIRDVLGKKVILLTPNQVTQDESAYQFTQGSVVSTIEKVAIAQGLPVICCFPVNSLTDGLHPNDAGYAATFQIIQAAIER